LGRSLEEIAIGGSGASFPSLAGVHARVIQLRRDDEVGAELQIGHWALHDWLLHV
jgi:hypothetical protein